MRIAHIISDTNIGGAGRYLLALLGGAKPYGWQTTVYVPEGPLAEAVRETQTADVVILPEGEKSFSVDLWRALTRLLRPSDVVHTHASLAGRLVAIQKGYPVVLTRHTIGDPLPTGVKPWKRALNRLVADRLTDRLIAVSEACRQRLEAEGVRPDNIDLIYSGIDPHPFAGVSRRQARESLGLSADHWTILSVARLARVKGLTHAIAAADMLKQAGYDFTWLIAGDGAEAEALRDQAAALGLQGHVRFLGFQPDIAPLLAAADVFVLPSLQEALGLSLLEAMAAGLPIVATNVGGIPELIDDGTHGVLVPAGSPQALYAALEGIAHNPGFSLRIGQQAKQRLLDCFTIERMWAETDAVYRRVTEIGGRNR